VFPMIEPDRWILGIADDLTGALEIGAKFAGQQLDARVTTDIAVAGPPEVPVLVIDTETRHSTGEDARAVVRDCVQSALRFVPWLVYKKTDSTLRGNIAAEFRALLELMPLRSLVYAPSYPEMGRTVKGGRLFVGELPVHEGAFAADPLNPVRESEIRAMLGGVPAVVLDGESSADLLAAAVSVAAMDPPPLAAGPAAFAGALAQCVASLRRAEVRPRPRLPRCLVVNGSLHPASAAQIAFARRQRCFEAGWRYFDDSLEAAGPDRASQVGERVRRLIEASPVDGLIVFGGDTALGLHRSLGRQPFEVWGEVLPGVPLSRSGDLIWATKAGGFGPPNVLCDIRRILT
jgi:D-threonate/D-erythronate kinase